MERNNVIPELLLPYDLESKAILKKLNSANHPFYDGNGRIGRIINVLYLVASGLLDLPILYLSRYITHNKTRYYHLIQAIRDNNDCEYNKSLME